MSTPPVRACKDGLVRDIHLSSKLVSVFQCICDNESVVGLVITQHRFLSLSQALNNTLVKEVCKIQQSVLNSLWVCAVKDREESFAGIREVSARSTATTAMKLVAFDDQVIKSDASQAYSGFPNAVNSIPTIKSLIGETRRSGSVHQGNVTLLCISKSIAPGPSIWWAIEASRKQECLFVLLLYFCIVMWITTSQ